MPRKGLIIQDNRRRLFGGNRQLCFRDARNGIVRGDGIPRQCKDARGDELSWVVRVNSDMETPAERNEAHKPPFHP
jgi:hypothetical protein